ncbi:Sodium/hydrogen exchanger [Lactarius tabidus]
MPWEFLNSSPASVAYVLLGGFLFFYSLLSLGIKQKLYMNEVVFGTGFGVLLGPHVLDIFDPRTWTGITDVLTREIMRIVLITGLFTIGVHLPNRYMAEHAKSLLIMVVPTMAFGWFVSATFIHVLFPKLDFLSSLVISACLTPTDPIISAAVIGGGFADKYVHEDIRNLLVAESASNDGLAYPFLSISIYLTTEASRATAFEKWIIIGCLYQVMLGTILGATIGYLSSRIMRFAQERNFVDHDSYVVLYVSLALFTVGAASSLGNDDLLAAFAAGCAISWNDDHFKKQPKHESFSSLLDLMFKFSSGLDFVFNCACFIYIGAWLPFDKFHISEIGVTPWRLVILMLVILTLRRIPSLLLLYKLIPEVKDWREALFCGYFGPIGVSAVFVSTMAQSRLKAPHDPPQTQEDVLATALQPIVAFVVLGSILTHGLSIPSFSAGQCITRSIARRRAIPQDVECTVGAVGSYIDPNNQATRHKADISPCVSP